ncbi:MAG: hypothetical protein ACI8RD_001627 [Bacillariaceae sp.]|jgi:hypothetical protein
MMSTTTTVVATKRRRHYYYYFFSKVWKQFYKKYYINFVKKYQLQIDLVDDTFSRLLFWLPHQEYGGGDDEDSKGDNNDRNDNNTINGMTTTIASAAWREVCYGMLSIHRLMMHLALEETETGTEENNNNDYGTSIQTRYPPTIAAKGIRICLTVIHSIMPSMLEIIRSKQQQNNNNNTEITTAKVRLILEQIKFLLRMYLLVPYWKQQQQPQQQNHLTENGNGNDNDTTTTTAATDDDCGILMDGGMYRIDEQFKRGITWEESKSIQRRRNYVGKRTGWKPLPLDNNNNNNNNNNDNDDRDDRWCNNIRTRLSIIKNNNNNNNVRTILAEFLYAFRPLVWAWFESRQYQNGKTRNENSQQQRPSSQSGSIFSFLFSNNWSDGTKKLLRGWVLCLGMDLLSIRLLEQNKNNNSKINEIHNNHNHNNKYHRNIRTEDEIRRRKLRLFLYALRSPVWSTATSPILDLLSKRILQKIPLLGNFIEIYIWDFILYYQHPFISEEG